MRHMLHPLMHTLPQKHPRSALFVSSTLLETKQYATYVALLVAKLMTHALLSPPSLLAAGTALHSTGDGELVRVNAGIASRRDLHSQPSQTGSGNQHVSHPPLGFPRS